MLPGQMVQTISVDVGDAAAVEKAMGEAVAKQGAVQVQERTGWEKTPKAWAVVPRSSPAVLPCWLMPVRLQ